MLASMTQRSHRVGLEDIAKRAGVSVPTAARILAGGNKEVWPAAAARAAAVRKAAAELGYRPNHAARTLAAGKAATIALAVADQGFFDSGIYPQLLNFALQAAARSDFDLLPVLVGADGRWRRQLTDHRVAGVLVTQPAPDDLPTTLQHFNVPAVLLNLASDLAVPQVRFDDASGMRAAVDHLVSLGHRQIAYWNYVAGDHAVHYSHAERSAGFAAALAAHQLTGRVLSLASREIATIPETAVICHNDRLAHLALMECQRAGRAVPGGLSIIGFDNEPGCEWTTPQLTSVRVAVDELVTRGFALLLTAIEHGGETAHEPIRCGEYLVARGTTSTPA
jgi:DNA-binding LacI/PurR family transcriptional regulator